MVGRAGLVSVAPSKGPSPHPHPHPGWRRVLAQAGRRTEGLREHVPAWPASAYCLLSGFWPPPRVPSCQLPARVIAGRAEAAPEEKNLERRSSNAVPCRDRGQNHFAGFFVWTLDERASPGSYRAGRGGAGRLRHSHPDEAETKFFSPCLFLSAFWKPGRAAGTPTPGLSVYRPCPTRRCCPRPRCLCVRSPGRCVCVCVCKSNCVSVRPRTHIVCASSGRAEMHVVPSKPGPKVSILVKPAPTMALQPSTLGK